MSVYDWSVTAANNDNADANINWTEGQAANSVNNSARAQMAAFAAFLQQINGAGTSAGAGNNYTFTSAAGNALTAYGAGNMICFKASHTNTTTADLNVDGLGAKPLKKLGSTDLVANDIETGDLVLAIYDGINFQIMSPVANSNVEALAGATGAAADMIAYFNGASSMLMTALTQTGRDLIGSADAAAVQSTLNLVPGTNVQVQDAELQAFANLTSAANLLPYFNGAGTMLTTGFTNAGRALINDSTNTAQRATLSIPENTREITFGTAAPGTLGTGEIYLRHG